MAKTMYDIIKKQNGERFAKSIRNYDNGIFDIPELDKIVKYAGRDAEPIMSYLISLKAIEIEEQGVHQDPITLLAQAGYDAYVADTLEKQNAIKKYYALGEELCTFRDPSRFRNYFIINAVRKDVAKIQRSETPRREDEYGTSVISIQILKSGGFISIKNRYNHTVENPDNTLNSNPDNIIPGLSDAIKHHFGIDFSAQRIELPNNYVLVRNQICRYNAEINNVYCAEDFYVKDGHVYEIDKRKEIMLGNGILFNLKDKKITDITRGDYDSFSMEPDKRQLFIESLNHAVADKKIQITKNPLGGYDIIADGQQILTVENGELVNVNIPDAECIYLSKMPNARGVMDFSNVKNLELLNADLSQVSEIKFNPNAEHIYMRDVKNMPQSAQSTVDFSGVKNLELHFVFSGHSTDVKLNPSASRIILSNIGWELGKSLDCSRVKYLLLQGLDASNVKQVKLNPNADVIVMNDIKDLKIRGDISFDNVDVLRIHEVDMSGVNGARLNPKAGVVCLRRTYIPLCGDLDFSNTRDFHLSGVDMSQVTDIKLPNNYGGRVYFRSVRNLNVKQLDLRNIGWAADLDFTDLSNVSEVLFGKGDIELRWVGKLNGVCDFTGYRSVVLSGVDLSNANVKFAPDAQHINLIDTKGLSGVLDFSNVQSLQLKGADLSGVSKIKLPADPKCIDVDPKVVYMRVGKSALQYRIEQLQQKVRNIFNIQEENNDK